MEQNDKSIELFHEITQEYRNLVEHTNRVAESQGRILVAFKNMSDELFPNGGDVENPSLKTN